MIILKDYQKSVIERLKNLVNDLLEREDNKVCVFKSPTGSGKTLMIAECLKELVEYREDGRIFSFIWAAPRQLHIQSKEKLEKYYNDSKVLKCSFFEDLADKRIGENEILFLNWESINKKENIYIRENEQQNNLSHILENTREEAREIILIIDESHHAAQTETSQNLVKDIEPKVTVEVSATPRLKSDYIVPVELEDVKREGMIKKIIAINPEFENIVKRNNKIDSQLSKSADELIVKAALQRREELAGLYQKEGTNINPLVLIQLPDRRAGLEDMKNRVVNILKDKFNITVRNGKLAIYLSEDKENRENIEKNDNEAEVLIFKQAIALGWDCPRATILVLFREWHSPIFSIQTVGRIMRMPEFKHYENSPPLNIGYVYTNLSNISIEEDIAKDYITVFESKRRKEYKNTDLPSCYSKRFREETRLSRLFIEAFFEAAEELQLENKVKFRAGRTETEVLVGGEIENIDQVIEHVKKEGTIGIYQTELELQRNFNFFVKESLPPFFPEPRSINRVKMAIYEFFKRQFKMDYKNKQMEIVNVILYKNNRDYFLDAINRAKEIYQDKVGKGKKELIYVNNWNIPERLAYNNRYTRADYKKSIMQPYFYLKEKQSNIEGKFIDYLEKARNVKWWFKNGDRDATYFAIPYREDSAEKPFYLDFIVQMKDGRIGLFDTKLGLTAKIAGPKAEGLARYIKNKKDKKLFGGIVTRKNRLWKYNNSEKYVYKEDDLTDWKILDLD